MWEKWVNQLLGKKKKGCSDGSNLLCYESQVFLEELLEYSLTHLIPTLSNLLSGLMQKYLRVTSYNLKSINLLTLSFYIYHCLPTVISELVCFWWF